MGKIHTLTSYMGASRTLDGDISISFRVEDIELVKELEAMPDTLVMDIAKYSPKRSLSANAYLWALCTEIARVLKSDKDTIYLMELGRYGVYVDIESIRDAIPALKSKFRYIEELDDSFDAYKDTITVRCYFGSSHYDRAEMQVLLDGIVRDAQDLGINTWSDEELKALVDNWKGDSYVS